MLFATNRMPRESAESQKNRKISFNLQNTGTSPYMYFCERTAPDQYTEIMSEAFFGKLKALPNEKTQVLLYIHGFNNTAEADVFPNAEKLQQLFDDEAGEGFVLVVPLIWPCDDDSVVAFVDDYWDDQRASDSSGLAFSRMLGLFDKWRRKEAKSANPCVRRINVLAHSMGNRVLRNAINDWVKAEHSTAMPQIFRNVFMVAADVVNHTMEKGHKGQLIPDSARNVIVYYANDDLAMPASKLANLKNKTVSRRLGMTGPESLEALPKNVYEVDCDDFNNSWDKPKGHTYFLDNASQVPSPIIQHMVDAMSNGRVEPDNRHHVLPKP